MTNDQYETLVSVDTKVTALLDAHLDHEKRIRSLEKVRNWCAGVGATIGTLLGYIFYPQH